MIVTKGEYNGHTLMVVAVDENDKFPASIGQKKAALFLANMMPIAQWVDECRAKKAHPTETMEVENKQYPWKLKYANAEKFLNVVEQLGKFAETGEI